MLCNINITCTNININVYHNIDITILLDAPLPQAGEAVMASVGARRADSADCRDK